MQNSMPILKRRPDTISLILREARVADLKLLSIPKRPRFGEEPASSDAEGPDGGGYQYHDNSTESQNLAGSCVRGLLRGGGDESESPLPRSCAGKLRRSCACGCFRRAGHKNVSSSGVQPRKPHVGQGGPEVALEELRGLRGGFGRSASFGASSGQSKAAALD